jgi:hypothetical protein
MPEQAAKRSMPDGTAPRAQNGIGIVADRPEKSRPLQAGR